MATLKETAASLAYRLAMGEGVTYGTLRMHARSGKFGVEELADEIIGLCRKHGIDAAPLSSSAPAYVRARWGLEKRPAGKKWVKKPEKERFPYRGLEKQARGGRYPKEKGVLSRRDTRDKWAREHGYASWPDYRFTQHAEQMGFKSRAEYDKAMIKLHGERYVALLSNLYRAGLQKESAERLAGLIVTKKNLPRARLRKQAWGLSKLPLLPRGKPRKVLDTSLQRYSKAFGKNK